MASLAGQKGLMALVAVFLLECLGIVFYGTVVIDEGIYLYAAQLVYEGKMPYLDFPLVQAPLLPYIYGLPQLFWPGILAGRFTALVFSLVAFLCGVGLSSKLSGRVAALTTGLLLASSPLLVWVLTVVRTEPVVVAMGTLSVFFFCCYRNSLWSSILSASAMACATAVRISYAPAFVLIILAMAIRDRQRPLRWLLPAVVSTSLLIVFVVLFILPSPDRALYNIIGLQVLRSEYLYQGPPLLSLDSIMSRAEYLVSLVGQFYPFFLLLGIVVFYGAVYLRRHGIGAISLRWDYSVMTAFVFVVFAPNLATWPPIPSYFVHAAPILAVLLGCAVANIWSLLNTDGARLVLASLLVSVFFLQMLCYHEVVSFFAPGVADLRGIGSYVASITPPDKEVVTLATGIAVEAGRKVAQGLEMSRFGYSPDSSDEEASHYRVFNKNIFEQRIRSESTGAVLLSDFDLGLLLKGRYYTSVSDEALGEAEIFTFFPYMRSLYRLVAVTTDPAGSGRLYIFLRLDGEDRETAGEEGSS